ncbi:hypothetical protein [Alkalihalobacterium alkalinitrilicum]|uniref:hypothetical protein n=1 Tax=Alkalihalobacterium alkalinitrilicum TaxID=427920 RepID=UPI0009950B4C|nr:hypothetical protein [Alkalihalobacterium alkalinitrilicum]
MIEYDKTNCQILSEACFNCNDPYFKPGHSNLPSVGCCSYSPVISLFEIYKMVKQKDYRFFMNEIYNNPNCTIYDDYIIIHAEVHPSFHQKKTDHLSDIEKDDLKLSFSTCQFFQMYKGCTLYPSYKNATCRSFICSTIESQLDDHTQKKMIEWTRTIQVEAQTFNSYHRRVLVKNKLSFKKNVAAVLTYLEGL